jgi:formamidopyrimidine-DNA glycosylase
VETPDRDVLRISPGRLKKALEGKQFASTSRKGKFMFMHLEDGSRILVLHFGMTGRLLYYRNEDREPDHARLLLHFQKGGTLAYDCMRKLGIVDLTEDVNKYSKGEDLGPDALSLSKDEFMRMFKRKRGMLKSALMDQTFMSGVGNVYSDEILFQAGFHPRHKTTELDDSQLGHLFDVMQEVLEKAIECGAQPGDFPENWLTREREEGRACPWDSTPIEKTKISGRSALFCPNHQK